MSTPTNTRTGLVQITAVRAAILALPDRAFDGARREIERAKWGKEPASRSERDEMEIQAARALADLEAIRRVRAELATKPGK